MTKKQLLDSIYVVHVLAAMILLNTNGNILVWLNNVNTSQMSLRAPGYLGVAIAVIALVIVYGGFTFRRFMELPLLGLIFIASLFSQTQMLNIVYLMVASTACFLWFFYRRNPPLF